MADKVKVTAGTLGVGIATALCLSQSFLIAGGILLIGLGIVWLITIIKNKKNK